MPDPAPTDPTALLDALNPDQIVQRLQDLDAESRALRVLLRAARSRERSRNTCRSRKEGEPCRG